MQITEASTDGLKRTLQVVVGADELNERFTTRLSQMKNQVQLKGFRKGRVPEAHLKKVYGKSLMAEILQQAVQETSTKALEERKERPAFQPDIKLTEDQAEIDRVINGEADLSYSMSFEIIPEIKLTDASSLKLERMVVDVEDDEVDKAILDLAERNVTFEPEEGRVAEDGDQVTMDFVGKIDGEAFEGGTGQGVKLVLGRAMFIPGFEEGLVGVKASEERVLDLKFPDNYQADQLAGKSASFEVKVTEVARPLKPDVSDAFAAALGVENLEKLKEVMRGRIGQEYAESAKMLLKRKLLDELDRSHDFELPPSMVDREFDSIWKQLIEGMEKSGKSFEDEGKTEDETKEEYREIAKRRIRLGLVIAEFGDKNKIEVTQDELRTAMIERARGFPGQEKMVYEYFEKTPGAIQELRAPVFEDKVVDFILELAKPTEKSVTKDELMKMVEDVNEAQDT